MFKKKKKEEQSVFLSKWGFHPCDYETYLKLKRLKKIYWEAVRTYGRWRRWDRKRPENRFYWLPRTRTTKRKRSPIPIPEPKCCPLWKPFYGRWPETSELQDNWLLDDFEEARMPKAKPEDVQPLSRSVKEIDELLEKAEKWMAEKKLADR